MKKILFQFFTIIILFFSTWFVLNQVNWVSVLKIKQHTKRTEEKLGDMVWDMIKNSETENTSSVAKSAVNRLKNRICEFNHIDSNRIKIHILDKDEVNAFALPNNHLVIYSGLIEACETEAELNGIISHEIAHMEKNHLMRKLINEVGLTTLVTLTSGNGGAALLKEIIKKLSSTAYNRKLETEADETAVEYMINAKIDPEPLAVFLFRLSKPENNIPRELYWISTHPDSEDRAKHIVEIIKDREITNEPVLTTEDWGLLKSKMKERT